VIYAETRGHSEILPAMEEGLRQRGLAGVVGEVARLGLTPSRRLQLAAEETGVPGFVIRRWRNAVERASGAEPSAAWRRAGVPVAALERLADADAFGSLGRSRRKAIWDVRALAGEPMPLFAAADQRALRPEVHEADVELAPMAAGREVVEDYRSKGVTLRAHPLSFLRADLSERGFIAAADLRSTRDRCRVSVAGLVLVRQRPGSANDVTFMTLEDETEVVNLIVWPSLFECQRRLVLSAGMIGCEGKVQREGEVIHVIADHLTDLTHLLDSVGDRDEAFPLPHGRGDEAKRGGGPDQRLGLGHRPRDDYTPDLRIEKAPGIRAQTRDSR
jgi:error-prone DNA polymerase